MVGLHTGFGEMFGSGFGGLGGSWVGGEVGW